MVGSSINIPLFGLLAYVISADLQISNCNGILPCKSSAN